MNIHLVGPTPPPFGGVSVHIMRLRRRLLERGHQCTVWGNQHQPEARMFRLGTLWQGARRLAHVERDAILHFHESPLLAGLAAAKRDRVLYTVHNERIRYQLEGGRFPKQWLFRKLSAGRLRRVKHFVAVSEWVKADLERFGIDASAITVVEPYLRPSEEEASRTENAELFSAFRKRHRLVATANAGAVRMFHGQDLYGIDLCLEVLPELARAYPDFGLVLAMPCAKGTDYLTALQDRARRLGVFDHVLWLLEQDAYYPILKQCDLFLRPTNTDGFGISIAEAFEHGIPVVASDAVPRPEGCLVFRNRDVGDLSSRIRQAIVERSEWSQRSLSSRMPDRFEDILAVYESL